MSLDAPPTRTPWIQTPCLRSAALSLEAGCNIYLKLENLQPSGSFKSRGIGHLMSRAISTHGPSKPIHFYCSSGGNAGLACATAAISLQRPATIVVPLSTSPLMIEKLKTMGADVVQIGDHWSEADKYLREQLLEKDKDGVYVPPFDHEDVWAGHSTLIEELEEQMSGSGAGRLEDGDRRAVKVLAMETAGADSLAKALEKGELVTLPAITSIATSLGAARVCQKAFDWGQRRDVTSYVSSDAEAAMGCVRLADDERIMVEAACGVNVAPIYTGKLPSILFPELSKEEFGKLNIVVVVCGGSNVTLAILEKYRIGYAKDVVMSK
ncbi:L-serine deaminase [Hyphodiscus hymeniophilus]|uniref:L-serine ammonia-lyase n=1 Tax=Hyphodiscus hymeniophilus TaxID=353542 RepID=A0A9P6VCB0_9HELO|nr:L-serine deaminase [Hyphodiscus hymeniophilus]